MSRWTAVLSLWCRNISLYLRGGEWEGFWQLKRLYFKFRVWGGGERRLAGRSVDGAELSRLSIYSIKHWLLLWHQNFSIFFNVTLEFHVLFLVLGARCVASKYLSNKFLTFSKFSKIAGFYDLIKFDLYAVFIVTLLKRFINSSLYLIYNDLIIFKYLA